MWYLTMMEEEEDDLDKALLKPEDDIEVKEMIDINVEKRPC